MELQPLLEQLVSYAVLALVGALALYARKGIDAAVVYLKAKVGVEQYGLLKETAAMQVRAFQQSPVYGQLDGAGKKERVIVAIRRFAEENGVEISYELVDKLIEEAVFNMKAELEGSLE